MSHFDEPAYFDITDTYSVVYKRFLDRGGVLVWGIVPTNFEPFENENLDSLEERLETLWQALSEKGVDRDFLFSRSLLSPAICCLVKPDGEKTVEAALKSIIRLSKRLRKKYGLSDG